MKRLLKAAIAGFLALVSCVAHAQTSPNWSYRYVPTTAEWNAQFVSKQDYLGAPPLLRTGGTMTGLLTTAPSTTSLAGLNIPPGVAPTSPNNGDIWSTAAGFFVQVNGSTVGPLTEGTSGSFTGSSPIVVSFPGGGVVNYACATCGIIGSPLSQFATTTSAQFLGVISDETGSGLVMGNNGPTMIAPVLGAATATSINKVTLTAPATSATLTILNGKTLTVDNSLEFAGTDATKMTFPGASDTVATLAATQTMTAKTLTSPTINGGALSGTFSGAHTLSGAVTLSSALTYGGVTLANSVSGTGSMVLGTSPAISSPTITGTIAGTPTITSPTINAGALSGTFSGNPTFSGVPSFTGLSLGTCSQSLLVNAAGATIIGACPGAASTIQDGATAITSGVATSYLFNNAGVLGHVLAATKAVQAAGTDASAVVTPAQQQNHPSAIKALCLFVGATTGTNVCTFGYNVTNVTRSGVGSYTLNIPSGVFTSGTSYSCSTTVQDSATNDYAHGASPSSQTATAYGLFGIAAGGGSVADPNSILVMCAGS